MKKEQDKHTKQVVAAHRNRSAVTPIIQNKPSILL